jgi:hypothetical protein
MSNNRQFMTIYTCYNILMASVFTHLLMQVAADIQYYGI